MRRHLDAAQAVADELMAQCPEVADRGHLLDCSRLPCVLSLPVPVGHWMLPEDMCGHPLYDEIDTHTLGWACEPTVVIPLWDGLDAPEVEERYLAERDHRTYRACADLQASLDAAAAP